MSHKNCRLCDVQRQGDGWGFNVMTEHRLPLVSLTYGTEALATKRRLSRSGIVKFLAEVEPCTIGMEACGAAHYWARRFRAMGHEVKLTPLIYVKPYVKRGKNDAADAAAMRAILLASATATSLKGFFSISFFAHIRNGSVWGLR